MCAYIKNIVHNYPKITIFSAALAIRLVLGFIFYGGADINSFIGITQLVLDKQWLLHPVWCYFPTICFHLWFCGWLCAVTPLPTAFCFKIIPILFDALLAVLIYDIIKKTVPKLALTTGLLYAFSPIGIIVTCIHGQWDSVVLFLLALSFYIRDFYQDSYTKYAVFGVLFALSFLLKPYTLLFSLFFFIPYRSIKKELGDLWYYLVYASVALGLVAFVSFLIFKMNRSLTINAVMQQCTSLPCLLVLSMLFLVCCVQFYRYNPWHRFSAPFKQYCRYQAVAVAGASITTGFCFICFMYYDFSIAAVIDTILRYSNQAAPTLGLPFAYPLVNWPLCIILKNRLWVLFVISALASLYYKEKIDVFKAIVASFALILGVNGLVPSYFVFLPPFLLITRFYKVSAVYSLAASVFYLLYYANPLANAKFPYESILAYVPLKDFSWLTPPLWITDAQFVPFIRFLSNYLLPMMCIGIFFYILRVALQQLPGKMMLGLTRTTEKIYVLGNEYLLSIGISTLIILGFHLVVHTPNLGTLYAQVLLDKIHAYNITLIPGYITGSFPSYAPFNILFILGLLALFWSFVAYKTSE